MHNFIRVSVVLICISMEIRDGRTSVIRCHSRFLFFTFCPLFAYLEIKILSSILNNLNNTVRCTHT